MEGRGKEVCSKREKDRWRQREIKGSCGERKGKVGETANVCAKERTEPAAGWATWPPGSRPPLYHLPRVCLSSPPPNFSVPDLSLVHRLDRGLGRDLRPKSDPTLDQRLTPHQERRERLVLRYPSWSHRGGPASPRQQLQLPDLQPRGGSLQLRASSLQSSHSPPVTKHQMLLERAQQRVSATTQYSSSSPALTSPSMSPCSSPASPALLPPSCSCCLASLRARTVGDPTSPCAFTQMGSQPVKRRRCKWSWWLLLLCSSSLLLLALVLVYLCHTTHIMEHGVPY